jgi:putative transposase
MVFIPKYRKKLIFEKLRPHLGEAFKDLAMQKKSKVEEGHLRTDHVHICYPVEI